MQKLNGRERNYGIDVLKVISMYMVVVLHVLLWSGVIGNSSVSTGQFWMAWFMESAAYCAVNCFAIATGYLMCGHKFKYRRIVPIILTALLYSVVITFVYTVFHPEYLNAIVILKLPPVLGNNWWYLTSYFCLFFFIPYINILIERLSKKQFFVLLLSGFLLISATNVIAAEVDLMETTWGYSVWWLMYCYLIGAWIKNTVLKKKYRS